MNSQNSDTNVKEKFKLKLVNGRDIPFKLDKIVQPTLNRIDDYGGEKAYNSLVYPFILSDEILLPIINEAFLKTAQLIQYSLKDIIKDENLFKHYYTSELEDKLKEFIDIQDTINSVDKSKTNPLEYFFIIKQLEEIINLFSSLSNIKIQDIRNSLFDMLINSIKFFFDTDDVSVNDNYFIINGRSKIDNDNFNELQEIILCICEVSILKSEKPKIFKNEKQKQIYERMQKTKKEYEEKHGKKQEKIITLADIANEVIHSNQSYCNYENIGNRTIWQIFDSLSTERIKEENQMNLKIAMNSVDFKGDLRSWRERIMDK